MIWSQLLSTQRHSAKADSYDQSRSAFDQDYDRIIFSHPFRRLQDKTQVHPLPVEDFVHTRLTHSLEVSSVGRSLGKKVGEEILRRHPDLQSQFSLFDFGAVVAAAALAHDLGNPPFGHAGEDAISDFFREHPAGLAFKPFVTDTQWNDLTRFEGNAQGFRLLNRKELGLKLTCATLGAFTKYPCAATLPTRDTRRRSQKKFGFFESEKEIFAEVAEQLGLKRNGDSWCRHPLAFLVEAADDICYSIIDLEDGCRLGLVSLDETIHLLAAILRDRFDRTKLEQRPSLNEKLGVLRSMAIGQLLDECTTAFVQEEKNILDATFDTALTDVIPSAAALQAISKVSIQKIYRARTVVEIEASGHKVLPGLLEEFSAVGQAIQRGTLSRKHKNLQLLLPQEMVSAIAQTPGDTYSMLRLIIDFVSGLTDRHALLLYRKINGISIS